HFTARARDDLVRNLRAVRVDDFPPPRTAVGDLRRGSLRALESCSERESGLGMDATLLRVGLARCDRSMIPNRGRLDPWERRPAEAIASRYYDATTWIYRRVWGRSFHFAPLRRGEPRRAAIRRYEHEMASALGLSASSVVLDLGCGVGGPAAAIAASTNARV